MSPYLASLRERVGRDLLLVPAAGAAVLDDAGRLLLARHADDGAWAIPGGAVEPGEPPEQAALRELEEETAVRAELVGLVGAYGGDDYEVTYPNGDRVAYVVTVHACRAASTAGRPDGDEVVELGWFDRAAAERLARSRDMHRIVPDVFGWFAREGRGR